MKFLGTSSGFKLNISLQDSSGNITANEEFNETERRSYFLNTTVTKSDNYVCVATQEEIHHQIYNRIYVSVPGEFICLYITYK